jgi:hypothetical protein
MGTLLSEIRESARIWREKNLQFSENFSNSVAKSEENNLPSTRIDSDHQACTDRELKGTIAPPTTHYRA